MLNQEMTADFMSYCE